MPRQYFIYHRNTREFARDTTPSPKAAAPMLYSNYENVVKKGEAIYERVFRNHRGNIEEAEETAEAARLAYRDRVYNRGMARVYNNTFDFDDEIADPIPEDETAYDVAMSNILNTANRIRYCVEYHNMYDGGDPDFYWADLDDIPTVMQTDYDLFGELVEKELERQREKEKLEVGEEEELEDLEPLSETGCEYAQDKKRINKEDVGSKVHEDAGDKEVQ